MKSDTRYFKVVNLEKYQHYTKRNPPWIKLHASTLEDYDFGRLQDASKMHLCAIWLLASRTDNKIPWDAEWISKRINATAEVDLTSLQDAGFIELIGDASNTLATRKQSATPETETETETETECRDREQNPVVVEVPSELDTSVQSQTAVKPSAGPLQKKPAKAKRPALTKSSETWTAYSAAYHNRYGVAPTRNQTVNGQMAQFITRVPLAEAPSIAAFYVGHNDNFYIRKSHSVGMLLADSEKLRTEWQNGRKVTGQKARQDEQTSTNFANAERAIEILERKDHERATEEHRTRLGGNG